LPPPRSPLFPYTTLFRSNALGRGIASLALRPSRYRGCAKQRAACKQYPTPFQDARYLRRSAHAERIVKEQTRVSHAIAPMATRKDRKSTRLNSSHVAISY